VSEDQVDIWKAQKEAGQEKRAQNRESSAEYLIAQGIPYTSNNGGVHLIIQFKGRRADFWPGTGKWVFNATTTAPRAEGRGVRQLVKFFSTIKTREDD
jgi:hypothetical protein